MADAIESRSVSPDDSTPRVDVHTLRVGVLGGTGEQGRGLARRFAMSGVDVVLGSRDAARAEAAAKELSTTTGGAVVRGASNAQVAAESDVVVVAVPWEGHEALLRSLRTELAGKLVVDCVNPLAFDKRGPSAIRVEEGSAAEQAAALLPESRVTAAFHHISAKLLLEGDAPIDTDVLVVGEDRADKAVVMALADTVAGMRGVDAGRLRLAAQLEGMTAVLIAVNRRYKCHAGIRLTDV